MTEKIAMPIIHTKLPDRKTLLECFSYDQYTGQLTWRERPREHFATDGAHKRFNDRYAFKRAGKNQGKKGSGKNYRSVKFSLYGVEKSYLEHRIIWKIFYGADPEDQLDHKNGNKIDNRIENLRECTNQQNCLNRKMKSNNTSGFKGVSHTKSGKFLASIQYKGKQVKLGNYTSPDEAYEIYCKAAQVFHGEFKNTPIPSPLTGEWVY